MSRPVLNAKKFKEYADSRPKKTMYGEYVIIFGKENADWLIGLHREVIETGKRFYRKENK